MIPDFQKTSLLIPSQLPSFVRENPDYDKFVTFLQAYYEWMEQNGNVTERSKNILNYKDIDRTSEEFLDYFTNEFLQYFPQEVLIDKKTAVKYARQLYYTKGTPASYQFLFRILYNSDFDVFYTKDAVLKASDGAWYVAKSLKLATGNKNFLKVNNYRLFGETTKTIATIENATSTGNIIEVFISDITRLFQSGEFVRVVDTNNQDILFGGQSLRAKIVGQISQIRIDPNKRGLLYETGDPVVVYGGLNSANGIGASATVGLTTSGSIQRINVIDGSYGYRENPNTIISFTNAPGATAVVGSIDPDSTKTANVALIPIETIALKRFTPIGNTNYFFSNVASANANTRLSDAFSFIQFSAYPISSIFVTNGGGGVRTIPTVQATSVYQNDIGGSVDLGNLGILSPIRIISGGHGYQANDQIVFSGGSGVGARANVTAVSNTGAITDVEYLSVSVKDYPPGGFGYSQLSLPTLTVQSANGQAANASLIVPGVLGRGATFSLVTDRTGSVTTINVVNPGEDYVSAPGISLKVEDILVSNVSSTLEKGDVIFQGTNANTSTYLAYIDSLSVYQFNNDPAQTIYNLRVYDYNTTPNTALPLKAENNVNLQMVGAALDSNYNSSGVRRYGDGNARANASFLNGLVVSQGQYLNSRGKPSSSDVLQSKIYNNFTYIISVEKEIEKYREILLNLLHPTGMNFLGRYILRSNTELNLDASSSLDQGKPIDFFTGTTATQAQMYANFTNKSNNIIYFSNLNSVNLANIVSANTNSIVLKPTNGPQVSSKVIYVNGAASTVTIESNVWLTFANVAFVSGNSGSNVINITSLTNAYNIINNGQYSNTAYPIKDIVYVGDSVLVDNNTSKIVQSVDFENDRIYLTTNLTSNVGNSYMAVNRTFVANTSTNSKQIFIYGIIGQSYTLPEITTENGLIIITQDDRKLLLG
jgi:hypothetical protein